MMEQHEENGNGSNQISEQISSPSSQHINVLISSQTNPLQQVNIALIYKIIFKYLIFDILLGILFNYTSNKPTVSHTTTSEKRIARKY